MTTKLHIIASRQGKVYSLRIDIETVWEPLEAKDSVEVDLLPDNYIELVLLNDAGYSRYLFPENSADD